MIGELLAMGDEDYRIIPAIKGRVQCLSEKKEPLEHCGFCIHCREFRINGVFVNPRHLHTARNAG